MTQCDIFILHKRLYRCNCGRDNITQPCVLFILLKKPNEQIHLVRNCAVHMLWSYRSCSSSVTCILWVRCVLFFLMTVCYLCSLSSFSAISRIWAWLLAAAVAISGSRSRLHICLGYQSWLLLMSLSKLYITAIFFLNSWLWVKLLMVINSCFI